MKNRMGIKTKVAVTTILFMGILTAAIATVGYKLYYDSVMESYVTYADTVLEYAYRATVKYSFGDMIAERNMPQEYETLRLELNTVKDCSDIEYLYAIYFEDVDDIRSLHYAINAKTQAELSTGAPLSEIYTYMGKPCEEGGFEEDTLLTLQQAVKEKKRENGMLAGYSDVYGHMLNGYRVVFDGGDNAVGLICVEIDINRINAVVRDYVRAVILIAALLTAVIIVIYMFSTRRYLIGPIERITASSDSFVRKMQSNAEPEELIYEDAHVRSGGELHLLADNVKSLADGVRSYMVRMKAATAEKERIGAELNVATQIQADMLPRTFPAFPDRKEFDIYATMTPAKEVGGDFYDFFLIDDDHLGLVMADVSGKGVPAALFMVIAKTLIKNQVQMGEYSPAKALMKVNEQLCEGNEAELFVTVWLAILEISTGKGMAANAGHEHPALRRADGKYELVEYRHSPAVATMEGIRFREHEFELRPGDSLFVYTDGVAEATDADNKLYGTERMLDALNENPDAAPKDVLAAVKRSVDEFAGDAPQFDDITMLCLKYNGVEQENSTSGEKVLRVAADTEKLHEVQDFVSAILEEHDCSPATQMLIEVSLEELFVNIAHYAYPESNGWAEIRAGITDGTATITLIDGGIPYDPLAKPDPDVTLSADDRQIGGLGIYMVKKKMDKITYERRDDKNVLTIKKKVNN